MKYIFLLIISIAIITSCVNKSELKGEDHINLAQEIVDGAIEVHGGELFKQAKITFNFRGRKYISDRKGGVFQYERIFINPEDSLQHIRDVLNNDAFYREINGERIEVVDSMASKYSNSVNSVIYFAVLPFGLNDPAVNKEYLGKTEIKGQLYHKLKITFEQEGGGKDFDDVFLYYFGVDSYQMDYFAYLYHTDGGGVRFREAFNRREVNEIMFSDYINFKMDTSLDFIKIDSLFQTGDLEKLSLIELEDISVDIHTPPSNE